MMPRTTTAILSALLAATTPHASAQTTVGCDASCPPAGYESDSSHLCPGSSVSAFQSTREHVICHPTPGTSFSFDSFRLPGSVTVLANYYTGCEAGRRESGVFAGIAQRIHDETGGKINFVSSLKGGGSCELWAGVYQSDALSMGLNGGVKPSSQPLTITDVNYDVRDFFFTPPYPHPSYIILDENLEVTYKSVGPCCGYVSYYDCTDEVALGLDGMLTEKIYEVYNSQQEAAADVGKGKEVDVEPDTEDGGSTTDETLTTVEENFVEPESQCSAEEFSDWSACSVTCGTGRLQFRHRANSYPVETRPCAETLPACEEQCVQEFGESFSATVVAGGLSSPRDLAFHPTPGIHLGDYSEGRTFHPEVGEEIWVANGRNHSISILASVGTPFQTSMSRVDRGYYHYMNNISALSFNMVDDSGRNSDQDTFNFFAVCNDNLNDYVGSKEANYFMGPTLYDSDVANKPGRKNTVNRFGEDCSSPADECFFLHADMLHESPACIGIAHDPEIETAYGSVFWAFDTTGDNGGDGGQLVRFDFSQPHGPGSMDHSVAVVRRYPEVKLYRDTVHSDTHAGMVVHPTKRVLFISNPAKGTVVSVHVDSGTYSRTAREEYPIFSNRLPSFEYSIYECVEQDAEFVSGLDTPTGLALSTDLARLFVAERGGFIRAIDVETGVILSTINVGDRGYTSIGGLSVSPTTGHLHFVDMDSNQVVKIEPESVESCFYDSHVNDDFITRVSEAELLIRNECGETDLFSVSRDYTCQVDATIPNGTLFDQVHTDTGYASDNPDVQSMAGMDEAAALLENRTDCEFDSELNLDALLLGGYYCHKCLPRNEGSSCDAGGVCKNVQWSGFTCDNEYFVDYTYIGGGKDNARLKLSSLHYGKAFAPDEMIELSRGVTYRFTVRTGEGRPVSIGALPQFSAEISVSDSVKSLISVSGVSNGPILVTVDDSTPDCLFISSPRTKCLPLKIEGGSSDCAAIAAEAPKGTAQSSPEFDGWENMNWENSSGEIVGSFLAHSSMMAFLFGFMLMSCRYGS